MLHISSWGAVQLGLFVLLYVSLLSGAMMMIGERLNGTWAVPFVGFVIVPFVAALIVSINEPVLTAVLITVPISVSALVSVGRHEGSFGVFMVAMPIIIIAILIVYPEILLPIAYVTVCIIGGCAP